MIKKQPNNLSLFPWNPMAILPKNTLRGKGCAWKSPLETKSHWNEKCTEIHTHMIGATLIKNIITSFMTFAVGLKQRDRKRKIKGQIASYTGNIDSRKK